MRRSAAPSQQGLAKKRPRFNPPFLPGVRVPQAQSQSSTVPKAFKVPSKDLCREHSGPQLQVSTAPTAFKEPSKALGSEPICTGKDKSLSTVKLTQAHGTLLKSKPNEIACEKEGPLHQNDKYNEHTTWHDCEAPGESSTLTEPFRPETQVNQDTSGKHASIIQADINKNSDLLGKEDEDNLKVISKKKTSDATKSSDFLCQGDNVNVRSIKMDSDTTEAVTAVLGVEKPVAPLQTKKPGLVRKPFMVKQATQAGQPKATGENDSGDDGPKCHYYSVMWCKLSKKKHKKWEGDALLLTRGRSVTLMDTEGKEIGKGSGYRPSELDSMAEGHTLCVGGKEIEVMGTISEEDWRTGKCFQSGSSSSISLPMATISSYQPVVKPFANPQKSGKVGSGAGQGSKLITGQPRVAKPLFDHTLPDALVLPRPPSSHQWQNNTRGDVVVDVVVDPHLASRLRPHQRQGVSFLYECIMGLRQFQGNGAILADEMGLGKTLQCITLIWTLLKQGPYGGRPVVKRVLIVTPGSLVKNWCREFRKWLGTERIKVFPVSSEKKVEEFKKSPLYPVMVISYEMMVRYADDLRQITFDLVVCDEGHRLKNSNIKTTSILSSLPVQRRILLTGTPVQNDLQEFYSIVEYCNPGVLGSSALFQRVYEDPILRSNQPSASREEKELGESRANELSRLTGLFVLRRTQEVINKYLPPKVEKVVFCQPTSLQLQLYKHLLRSPLLRSCLTRGYSVGSSSAAGSPHLVCIGALKKLCNDPSLLYKASKQADEEEKGMGCVANSWLRDDDEEVSLYKGLLPLYPLAYGEGVPLIEHCGKLCVLREMLRALHSEMECRERIVIVSNYTQTLDLLQAMCSIEGYQFSRLDGSTPTAKRQAIVEHFNSNYAKETIFLLSSKAGGVGLNLIGASRLLLYDIDWNPANDLQAMARVWRDGQKKTVHIYRLITAGTIEEKIYQRQISKQSLSGSVVDAKGQASIKFSLEDLKDLFTLHEGSACITHDLLGCDCQEDAEGKPGQRCSQSDQAVVQRACQLGRPQKPATAQKNLSMGELKDWQHYSTPHQDESLAAARERITFVFQNETNMAPASAPSVT